MAGAGSGLFSAHGNGSLLYSAPSERCAQTFRALGWDVVTVEPALRDIAMGRWVGRTLDEIAVEDGAGLAAWM